MSKIFTIGIIVLILFIGAIYFFQSNKTEVLINEGDDIAELMDEETGPVVLIEPQNYNFGDVKLMEKVSHEFTVYNKGNEALEILRLSTSCGCTSAEVIDEVNIVNPNESVQIMVTFDPSVHKDSPDYGDVVRIVYLKTNDLVNPEVEFEINANVVK